MSETEQIKFVKSGRGTVLLFQGYRFHSHAKYKKETSQWRCENYKKCKLSCKGTVTLCKDKASIIFSKPHCKECIPDAAQNLIEATISASCAEASTGREPAPRVYKKAVALITEKGWHLAANKPIPTFDQKKSAIYRLRNKTAGVNKTSSIAAEDVEVPVQYQDFLLADYEHEGMRIMVFCSKDAKQYLNDAKHLFMDGTYQSCPSPFRQIYSIHADIGSDPIHTNIVPLVFALMSHQNEEAYTILFNLIQSQVPDWQPEKVTLDFERAAFRALSKLNVQIVGCHYHFTNSLLRKAKKLGIKKTHHNNRIISLCGKLALLPEHLIPEGWAYIQNELGSGAELKKFSNYFSSYWMRNEFYKMWSVYGQRHRTNNSLEGWHHSLNTQLKKNEARLLQVLHVMHQESTVSAFRRHRLQKFAKSSGPRRSKQMQIRDDRIRTAQMQLIDNKISVGHFLEKMR